MASPSIPGIGKTSGEVGEATFKIILLSSPCNKSRTVFVGSVKSIGKKSEGAAT